MKRILVIDDDVKTTSPLVDDLIATYGFEVVYLESPKDVISILKGSKFDIVILDIMMPTPNNWTSDQLRRAEKGLSTGVVLHEWIREEHPELPVVIYSAKKVTIAHPKTVTLHKPELTSRIVEELEKIICNEK